MLGAFQANAIKRDGTLSPLYTIPELLAWANDGNLEVEKMIRTLMDDYFSKFMNTQTDTTAQKIGGIDYTPSVTLQIPAMTSQITLPPNFNTLLSIRVVTPGFEFMEFEHSDLNARIFQEYLRVPLFYSVPPGGKVYYDIIGEQTLYIAPQVTSPMDIEIVYISDTAPLVRYATGTLTVADAATAVTGVGTVWKTGTPFDPLHLDLMTGITLMTAVDPSWSYDGVNRSRVAAITADTTLTLASGKVGAVAGVPYILSSVPVIPPEHHNAIADFVTSQMLAKAGNTSHYALYLNKWEARKRFILNTINVRQPDTDYVEDYSTGS
jgi:hypothetical protein